MRSRRQKVVFSVLALLLVLSAAGCKKERGDESQGGTTQESRDTSAGGVSTAASSTSGPWNGTVSIDYVITHHYPAEPSEPNRYVVSGRVGYSDLERHRDVGPDNAALYSAVMAGEGGTRGTQDCQLPDYSFKRFPLVYTWKAAGLDNGVPAAFPDSPVEHRSPLVILEVDDPNTGARGTKIMATRMLVKETQTIYCGAGSGVPNGTEYTTTVDNVIEGFTEMASAPMPDDDADPHHLVGSVTYTMASPPYDISFSTVHIVDYRYTITYDLRRTGPTCADAPEHDPVRCYAPLVHVADGEDHRPMAAEDFIQGSRLKWSKNNCPDKDDFADGPPDPGRLGSGGYVYDPEQELCKGSAQRPFASNEMTRPYMALCQGETGESGCKSSALGEGVEGFFLDPASDILDGASVAAIQGGEVPAYYQFVPGGYVAYWFFWPYSVPGAGAGGVLGFEHQGDWEHIVVRLDERNRATAVEYFFHHWWASLDWNDVARTKDGHPIVHAAEEGHGSYWSTDCNFRVEWPGSVSETLKLVQGKTSDRCSDAGPRWETWKNLRDTSAQPWYGFGGAWGEVGGYEFASPLGEALAKGDTTGPPAPHPDFDPTSGAQPDAQYVVP